MKARVIAPGIVEYRNEYGYVTLIAMNKIIRLEYEERTEYENDDDDDSKTITYPSISLHIFYENNEKALDIWMRTDTEENAQSIKTIIEEWCESNKSRSK